MKNFKIKICVILLLLTVYGAHAQNTRRPVIVLVHGAWSDQSAWNMVKPYLKAAGYEVITFDLPAHGKDNTPYNKIELSSYVNKVVDIIGDRKVFLVGHSFAGIIIGEVAEKIPAQINKLIYLSAYIPQQGQTVLQLSGKDKQTLLPANLIVNKENGTGTIKMTSIAALLAADGSVALKTGLGKGVMPEPLKPFNQPATITLSRFGQVKKAYIITDYDKAIGVDLQTAMAADAHINAIHHIKSSHLSMLVKPKNVAEFIIDESK